MLSSCPPETSVSPAAETGGQGVLSPPLSPASRRKAQSCSALPGQKGGSGPRWALGGAPAQRNPRGRAEQQEVSSNPGGPRGASGAGVGEEPSQARRGDPAPASARSPPRRPRSAHRRALSGAGARAKCRDWDRRGEAQRRFPLEGVCAPATQRSFLRRTAPFLAAGGCVYVCVGGGVTATLGQP